MSASPAEARPLRSDAHRNRERVLASAPISLARYGAEASVEEITRRAGVGMGTLYRHFPTKEALIDAVLDDAFTDLVQIAEQAVADEDAWRGFPGFLERALALHAAHRGLKDMLVAGDHGRERTRAMRARIQPLLAELIDRAQAQGALRPDFTAPDVSLVFWASGRVIEASAAVAPEHWRRYLGFLLDGPRWGAATPLPVPPLTASHPARAAGRQQR